MVLNRTIIKENFNQASNSYDAYASIQKQSAVYLISYLQKCFPNFCPKTILDLGTGTGYIPEVLLRIYPKSHMHLNDLSPRMIDLVKNKFQGHKQISYEVGDMENISLNPSELISTNFSIQWAADIFGLIKKCYASSNIFAFTCLLEHNFKEWEQLFIHHDLPSPLHKYPSKIGMDEFLQTLNPDVFFSEEQTFELAFEKPLDFARYLKKLGATTSNKSFSRVHLNKIFSLKQNFSVTYHVFFALVMRGLKTAC